jgi:hypothetical protein
LGLEKAPSPLSGWRESPPLRPCKKGPVLVLQRGSFCCWNGGQVEYQWMCCQKMNNAWLNHCRWKSSPKVDVDTTAPWKSSLLRRGKRPKAPLGERRRSLVTYFNYFYYERETKHLGKLKAKKTSRSLRSSLLIHLCPFY